MFKGSFVPLSGRETNQRQPVRFCAQGGAFGLFQYGGLLYCKLRLLTN